MLQCDQCQYLRLRKLFNFNHIGFNTSIETPTRTENIPRIGRTLSRKAKAAESQLVHKAQPVEDPGLTLDRGTHQRPRTGLPNHNGAWFKLSHGLRTIQLRRTRPASPIAASGPENDARAGGDQARDPPAAALEVRLLSRRALLPRLRTAPLVGLCRPRSAHRLGEPSAPRSRGRAAAAALRFRRRRRRPRRADDGARATPRRRSIRPSARRPFSPFRAFTP